MAFFKSIRPLAFVAIGLVALYFLPQALTRRNFRYVAAESTSAKPFPIDSTLVTVWKDGKPTSAKVTLSELFAHRTEVLFNFWATWCPPCVEELPSLEILNRELSQSKLHRPLKLVLISVDENPDIIKKFLSKLSFQASFYVLHDPGGKISQSMGTSKFPETYWVDGHGKTRYKWIGPQNWLSKENILRLTS